MRYYILFTWLFIFKSSSLFSQKTNYLFEKGDSICKNSKNEVFCKAIQFYRNKQYDSCYAYSSRALMMAKKTEEIDYFYSIHGYSALTKGFYKKSLSSLNSISDSKNYAQLKNYLLASVYLNQKKYEKSVVHYERWLSKDKDSNEVIRKAVLRNLGLSYIHLKKYDVAKDYFNKELTLIKKTDTASMISAKMDLANVYYNQYLDNDAIPLFLESYNLAKSFSDVELKQNSSLNMAVVERNRKGYKESVEYYREFIKWKDSIWNRDRIIELADKDKEIVVAQKDSEIAIQGEKLKTQKVVQRALIFGASGLLLFLGFLGFFYKKLKKQNVLITQQKEDLNIANKTKNYLFSVVSHDLRSPMNTIQYQHEQLSKHIATNNIEGIKEANNTAIAVTKSTSHLLNNVLHWSLEQSNQLLFAQGEHALRPIVEHVLYDYETLVSAKDIRITSELENQLVKVDKESLKIVVRNLIDNAIKYMNGSGSINITTGKESEQYSYIKISDSGIGISKEQLEKINALTDLSIDKIDRSEGVGLGLILCQTLIKKNNGILTFNSELGKGTTVTILLENA